MTRSNPCCEVLTDLLKSKRDLGSLPFELFLDRKLILNLPLMIVDLKEYLLERRITRLEYGSKEYLSNSIDYMRACKNYQSRYLQNNLQDVLNDKTKDSHLPLLKLAKTDVSKYVVPKNKESLPTLVQESDSSPDLRLDKVNDYWKKSNGLVSQFVDQLTQPASHPKTHVVKMDPNLVKKYSLEKTRSSIPTFHWESIRADKRKLGETEGVSIPSASTQERKLNTDLQDEPGKEDPRTTDLANSEQQMDPEPAKKKTAGESALPTVQE